MSETPAAQRRRLGDLLLGRVATVSLAGLALASGIATFVLLSGDSPLGPTGPGVTVAIILANTAVLLLLGGILVGRLVRLLAERRRGSAGARLQVRLVLLFGGVASVPALLVAVFSAVFFNLGIQAWFSDRVRSALETAVLASRAYLDDNRNAIRADALAMAADLRARRERRLDVPARCLDEHLARDRGDDRQDHHGEHEGCRENRPPGGGDRTGEEGDPAEVLVQPDVERLQKLREHERTPESVHDGGDRGEEVDDVAERPGDALRGCGRRRRPAASGSPTGASGRASRPLARPARPP